MRIVVNDHLGHAPQVQLSRALAARGHDVLHLYSSEIQSPKADLENRSTDAATLKIEGVNLGRLAGGSFLGDRLHETRFGWTVGRKISAFRPDVVVGCNNPLDVQREVQRVCRRRRIPFVYWMQDFYAARMDRLLAGRAAIFESVLGSYYHALEMKLLQRSSAVVTVSHDFLGILAQCWDVFDRQCMVVRNWTPLDAVTPGSKVNRWSQLHGLDDKKVVLYAGALGPMENPMLLPSLARMLSGRPDVRIVVVAEGDGAAQVAGEAAVQGLANLVVLPYQPYETYGDVLATADVLLGLVGADVAAIFVPSKVASYFCAGRPVVLAAPWQNLAAQAVRESDGGRVVPPDDPAVCAEAVLGLLDDNALREESGQRARLYAEKNFDIVAITDRFERLLERLHLGPVRRRQRRADSPVLSN